MILPLSFYRSNDVVGIAKSLIGKSLHTNIGGKITAGIINETEAYAGIRDKASHAYGGRRTQRTEVMYANGGISYVYLCYGMHNLFNIVTGGLDLPHAVLIRSIIPTCGIDIMRERTNKFKGDKNLSNGPGKLSKALGICKSLNAHSLLGPQIWVEDNKLQIPAFDIEASRRIGIDYAEEDALLPYRFFWPGK